MKISIFGTGYVGLVTGVCLAELGHEILCVDVNTDKISKLKMGISPLHEPDLEDLIQRNLNIERLSFSSSLLDGVKFSSSQMICVGTPSNSDGSADLTKVFEVARFIAAHSEDHKTIIVKSTVPVGTSQQIRKLLNNEFKNKTFDLVSNPEFLREGTAVRDCMNPERIVVGIDQPQSETVLRNIYAPYVQNGYPLLVMDLASSEMAKYAANSMLATKISLMNELSLVCDSIGADIEKVREVLALDPRIGPDFIKAGIGYGGSCLPKDVKAMVQVGQSLGQEMRILAAVDWVNFNQRRQFFNRLRKRLHPLKNKTVALLGVSFKAGTDDLRDAPSVDLINWLTEEGATVKTYDPVDLMKTRLDEIGLLSKVVWSDEISLAVEASDAICFMTEDKEFKQFDFSLVKKMNQPLVFDGKNLFLPESLMQLGIEYFAVGRKPLSPTQN